MTDRRIVDEGRVVTAGGRVLGVTALGNDLASAVKKAYQATALIKFNNAHYRRDIAASDNPLHSVIPDMPGVSRGIIGNPGK